MMEHSLQHLVHDLRGLPFFKNARMDLNQPSTRKSARVVIIDWHAGEGDFEFAGVVLPGGTLLEPGKWVRGSLTKGNLSYTFIRPNPRQMLRGVLCRLYQAA